MFNNDQKEYMSWLSTISPKNKCWCGWFLLEECNCEITPKLSKQDALNMTCSKCGNYPYSPSSKLIHIRGCENDK